jgi:formate dehydrogenase major subunit
MTAFWNRWPLVRQLGRDRFGLAAAAQSETMQAWRGRTADAKVTRSVCPFCGVGCGQLVYSKNDEVIQIEGDPDSPISRGRLCPKGAASRSLVNSDSREYAVKYRRPYSSQWESLPLDRAMDMIADRVIATRSATWRTTREDGVTVNRTEGIAHLGGATLDNEENYLMKKLYTALGVVQVENQARICHSPTVGALQPSFGRGGATTFQHDLMNSDCIVIMGSNMAEAHPVGFQWVMEAKARGATLIHVDPRFTRTSAVSDLHVAIRPGSDIAFLGGLINYILSNERDFREYVVEYSNASVLIDGDFKDTDELGGVFSGWDPEKRSYDITTWQYRGERWSPQRDRTLQDPNCVYQILKRHYARYTPETVADVCGIRPEQLIAVAEQICQNSGPERTGAFAYALGWTNHSTGVQMIRAAAIVQTLLGNIGRPGGGIMALRGHASIQGSTDIPTLFNLLPGYLPMPVASQHPTLESFVDSITKKAGFWAAADAYVISLLKAWFGERATAENDYCYDLLPRIDSDESAYGTTFKIIDGSTKGFFIAGENPAVGSAHGALQRTALARLDWLVVRDLVETESVAFWHQGPEIETGALKTEEIGTEVFFMPAASHVEKKGSFTNTDRLLQWRHKAVEPKGDARSETWFYYHLGRIIREKIANSKRPEDRLLLALEWDYPLEEPHGEPDADAILAEINGYEGDRNLSTFTELRADGSTSCGCWVYCGVYKDGVNQAARRKPHTEQSWVAPEWAWAWPANRRILYNRASAKPDGTPWSDRKKYVWWDASNGIWTGHDVPDFPKDTAPDYRPADDATGLSAIGGTSPFVMQEEGLARLFTPEAVIDGPLPTHYEAQESPVRNPLYEQQKNPMVERFDRPDNPDNESPPKPGDPDRYPFILTTYRLTEHFTAGGMTRTVPHLGELQPELFCEIDPELAALRGLEHGAWATIVTSRAAVEARVLVTERMRPFETSGKKMHVVGLPFHWGTRGVVTGDVPNDLLPIALDPNTHIQESKALTCDIVAGRRPRGPARTEFVERHRRAPAAL